MALEIGMGHDGGSIAAFIKTHLGLCLRKSWSSSLSGLDSCFYQLWCSFTRGSIAVQCRRVPRTGIERKDTILGPRITGVGRPCRPTLDTLTEPKWDDDRPDLLLARYDLRPRRVERPLCKSLHGQYNVVLNSWRIRQSNPSQCDQVVSALCSCGHPFLLPPRSVPFFVEL